MEHDGLSKRKFTSITFIAGLALFSMLFGAGNLILPIRSGIVAGDNQLIGLLGFLLSGVGFPLLGLLGIVLFDGDYQRFFYRLGKPIGSLIIGACLLVVGPMIGIPRIIVMLYSLVTKHLPVGSPTLLVNHPLIFVFMILFLIYLLSYREQALLRILTRYINPILISSLLFVIGIGYLQTPLPLVPTPADQKIIFTKTFLLGYQTLDLLAMLFFYSFMFSMLKNSTDAESDFKRKTLSYTGLKAGLIGLLILLLIYVGLVHLGSNYSPLTAISHGAIFDAISSQMLGTYGAYLTGLTVFFACLSTAMALCAIVAEWLQHIVFNNALGYKGSLLIVLGLCLPFSSGVLDSLLELSSGPLSLIGYPVIVTITICNILYKTVGFKYIKLPAFIVFLTTTIYYLFL